MKIQATEKVRIDKWLWAVRFFKTRTLASDACHAGKIKIDGETVKASRYIKIGDTLTISKDTERWVVKVVQLIENRAGAPIAITCYENLTIPTTPEQQIASAFYSSNITRDKGTGRPTKKERRSLDRFVTEEDSNDNGNDN